MSLKYNIQNFVSSIQAATLKEKITLIIEAVSFASAVKVLLLFLVPWFFRRFVLSYYRRTTNCKVVCNLGKVDSAEESTSGLESITSEKTVQNQNKTTVKVRLNEGMYVEVNREKLVQCSPYFKSILSTNFKDHKQEFVEVKHSMSFDAFESAIEDYIEDGELYVYGKLVFEIYRLADYLLMDKLKEA